MFRSQVFGIDNGAAFIIGLLALAVLRAFLWARQEVRRDRAAAQELSRETLSHPPIVSRETSDEQVVLWLRGGGRLTAPASVASAALKVQQLMDAEPVFFNAPQPYDWEVHGG